MRKFGKTASFYLFLKKNNMICEKRRDFHQNDREAELFSILAVGGVKKLKKHAEQSRIFFQICSEKSARAQHLDTLPAGLDIFGSFRDFREEDRRKCRGNGTPTLYRLRRHLMALYRHGRTLARRALDILPAHTITLEKDPARKSVVPVECGSFVPVECPAGAAPVACR